MQQLVQSGRKGTALLMTHVQQCFSELVGHHTLGLAEPVADQCQPTGAALASRVDVQMPGEVTTQQCGHHWLLSQVYQWPTGLGG